MKPFALIFMASFFLISCLTVKSDRRVKTPELEESQAELGLAESFKNDRYGPVVPEKIPLYFDFDHAMKALGVFEPGFLYLSADQIRKAVNRFHLDDFTPETLTGKSLFKLFSQWSEDGVDFAPMLRSVRHAMVLQNPAFVDMLQKAHQYGWLNRADPQFLKNFMASMMILEGLTVATINSNQFGKEIHAHYFNELKKRGVDSSSLRKSLSVLRKKLGIFPAAKFVSITPGIVGSVVKGLNKGQPFKNENDFRDKLKQFGMPDLNHIEYNYARYYGEETDRSGSNEGLRVNVAEATIADYRSGQMDNSRSGAAMMLWAEINRTTSDWYSGPLLPVHSHGISEQIYHQLDLDSVASDRENFINRTHLSEDFVAVYETWNASFVLSEFGRDDLEYLSWLWPKLFIPSTISSTGPNYLSARIWSLWLAGIQHILNRMDEDSDDVSTRTSIGHQESIREAALTWGNINRNYARVLFDQCTPFSNANANIWFRSWVQETSTVELLARALFNRYPSIIPKKYRVELLEKNLSCLKNS